MGDIHIHIKKQHLVIFFAVIGIFGIVLLGNALDTSLPWHPLGQVDFSEGQANSNLDLGGNNLMNYGNDFASTSWMDNNFYDTSESYSQSEIDNNFATTSYVSNNYATKSYVSNNYATKSYVDSQVSTSTNAVIRSCSDSDQNHYVSCRVSCASDEQIIDGGCRGGTGGASEINFNDDSYFCSSGGVVYGWAICKKT